jgi:DNA polymerase III sliding clamp (beta) subunit (PCNA family)
VEFSGIAKDLAKALGFVMQHSDTVRLALRGQKLILETRSQTVGIQLEADVTANGDGTIIVPIAPLAALLRNLGERTANCVLRDDGRLAVNAGKSKTVLGVFTEDAQLPLNFSYYEYPPMMLYAEANDVEVALGKVVSSAALISATHPILESIFFDVSDDTFRLVGCDGQKVAWAEVEAKWQGSSSGVIVPLPLISEIRRRLPSKIPIEIAWNKGLAVSWPGARIVGPVLTGLYPAYSQLAPPEFKHQVTLNRKDLLTAAQGMCAIAPDSGVTLRLSFQQHSLDLALLGSDTASAWDEIPCENELELDIGFVPRNFLQGLKEMTTENVTLKINDPMHVIEIVGDPGFRFFTMPVALTKRIQ